MFRTLTDREKPYTRRMVMKVLVGQNPMGLEKGIPALQEQYPSIQFVYCPDRGDELTRQMADTEIYMGWLNRDLFLAAPNLKWIQSPSSGVNHYLDVPELLQGDVV